MALLEILGALLGVIGVWLMIRRNVWGWPVGIVQVALYAWIFFKAKLYSDAILQEVQNYGVAWRNATSIIQPRFVKFAARWDF